MLKQKGNGFMSLTLAAQWESTCPTKVRFKHLGTFVAWLQFCAGEYCVSKQRMRHSGISQHTSLVGKRWDKVGWSSFLTLHWVFLSSLSMLWWQRCFYALPMWLYWRAYQPSRQSGLVLLQMSQVQQCCKPHAVQVWGKSFCHLLCWQLLLWGMRANWLQMLVPYWGGQPKYPENPS